MAVGDDEHRVALFRGLYTSRGSTKRRTATQCLHRRAGLKSRGCFCVELSSEGRPAIRRLLYSRSRRSLSNLFGRFSTEFFRAGGGICTQLGLAVSECRGWPCHRVFRLPPVREAPLDSTFPTYWSLAATLHLSGWRLRRPELIRYHPRGGRRPGFPNPTCVVRTRLSGRGGVQTRKNGTTCITPWLHPSASDSGFIVLHNGDLVNVDIDRNSESFRWDSWTGVELRRVQLSPGASGE